jgi:hypothetical protein
LETSFQHSAVFFFPLFFLGMWLGVTTILSLLSGWFVLASRFPDREAEPIQRFSFQSGMMGFAVGMHGILTLTACNTGLRVGMMRLFGPFSRDFFVPWENVAITRKTILFEKAAKLQFGNPAIGRLSISAALANKMARVAGDRWPETGPLPEEKRSALVGRLLIQWALITGFAGLFFTLAPMLSAPNDAHPPILVAFLFPAVVFGIVTLVRFLRNSDR